MSGRLSFSEGTYAQSIRAVSVVARWVSGGWVRVWVGRHGAGRHDCAEGASVREGLSLRKQHDRGRLETWLKTQAHEDALVLRPVGH